MRSVGVFLLTILFAMPAFSGVVFEIEAENHEDGKTYKTELMAEGGNLKIGMPPREKGAKDGFVVYRGNRREMVMVDHENSAYSVFDEKTIRAISGQMSSAMSEMQEALKNVPEDKRAMMEQMMKQRMPAQQPKRVGFQLENTGERATKSGYPCVKYIVHQDGRKVRELWVTDWQNIEGGREAVDTVEDMADFFRDLLDAIPTVGEAQSLGDPSWEHMKELGGFPVVTRDFGNDGALKVETVLRSAKRQTIEPSAFEPPSGYKRQEMFGPNQP
jgi:hypothetical protein